VLRALRVGSFLLSSPALRDCFFGIYAELVEVAMEKERKKKEITYPLTNLVAIQGLPLERYYGMTKFHFIFIT